MDVIFHFKYHKMVKLYIRGVIKIYPDRVNNIYINKYNETPIMLFDEVMLCVGLKSIAYLFLFLNNLHNRVLIVKHIPSWTH